MHRGVVGGADGVGRRIRFRLDVDLYPGRYRRERVRRRHRRAYRRISDRQVRPHHHLPLQPAGIRHRRGNRHVRHEPAHGGGGRGALRPVGGSGRPRIVELHLRNVHLNQARREHRHQPVRMELRPGHHLPAVLGPVVCAPWFRGRRQDVAARWNLRSLRWPAVHAHPVLGAACGSARRMEPAASAAGVQGLGGEAGRSSWARVVRPHDGQRAEEPRQRQDHRVPGGRVSDVEPGGGYQRPVHAVPVCRCRQPGFGGAEPARRGAMGACGRLLAGGVLQAGR